MPAPDAGAAGGTGGQRGRDGSRDGQGGSRDGQGDPNGQGGAGAAGGARVAGSNAGSISCVPARGQGAEPVPADRRPGIQLNEFTLTVPFPSPLEAEIARRSLAPYEEPHQQAIHKEFTVNGSLLIVRWTAEDAHLLRISFISFLDQLSLMLRTMRRFGPLLCPNSLPGKGG
uniref:L antigen family member 3 n=1 Tax=Microcebus murinus TaxID=30608 RepID=A0A8C6EKW8_MICMU|nr:EKC/KEOPS complex subunit LAGE3-like [Microcebus murinus]